MKKDYAKDAKEKTLGAIGHLKHLLKDPIKTVAEGKQRMKEITTFALVNLGIVIAPVIIGRILNAIFESWEDVITKILFVPVFIGFAGLAYAAFLFMVMSKIMPVLKLRECQSCGEQITYGDNVQYDVLRKWVYEEKTAKSSAKSNHVTVTVKQTEKVQVRFICTCQNCGTEKQFENEFNLAQYVNGNLKWSHDLDYVVKGFFTGEYIQ